MPAARLLAVLPEKLSKFKP